MREKFMVRLLHKKTNTTLQVSEGSLRAMLDMALRMIRDGELEAFSVVRNH